MRIAYCLDGEGPPLLICPVFVESFSYDATFPELKEIIDEFARHFTVIRYDGRGTGLSDRGDLDMSPPACALDTGAVVEAAGFPKVSVLGCGASGTWAAIHVARHPETVEALVLWNTYIRPLDAYTRESLEAFAMLARSNWPLAAQVVADTGTRQAGEVGVRLAATYQRSTDGECVAQSCEGATEWEDDLDFTGLTIPTLIMQRVDDPVFTLDIGRSMATRIPGARMVPLPAEAFFGGGAALTSAIETAVGFLMEIVSPADIRETTPIDSSFRAVLFTDLVGHTEMMARLGDDAGRAVLREHEDITRKMLKEHGGTEVKTMGDGFMASFGSVVKAVECAVAMQRAFEQESIGASEERLSVRVGINAGEPIEEDGDLFGATVILASRIAAKAGGGEILVADTVRGLCSGKGFLFSDRGEFVAKGFEEPVRVYEVKW